MSEEPITLIPRDEFGSGSLKFWPSEGNYSLEIPFEDIELFISPQGAVEIAQAILKHEKERKNDPA